MEERCFFSAGISRSYRLRMSRTEPSSGNCSESLLLPAKSRNTPKKSTRTCIASVYRGRGSRLPGEAGFAIKNSEQCSGDRVQAKKRLQGSNFETFETLKPLYLSMP